MSELFPAIFGRGVAHGLGATLARDHGPPVVLSQPEPWAALEPAFGTEPATVVTIRSLDRTALERLVRELPDGPLVGIGGGTVMDATKWVGWQRSTPFWQVPSLPSVDACFTHQIAVREGTGVHYQGRAVPEMVYVDYDLMRTAPAHLIRGGIGDALSCHTARWDWAFAVDRGHDPAWNEASATLSLQIVDRLDALAPEIAALTDTGIGGLMQLLREIGRRCDEDGHARFEEGSEHFFAYAFEHLVGRTIMHGELVTLGVLVMATLQDNQPELARSIAERSRVRRRPSDLGIAWEEVEATVRGLRSFVEGEGLWYSVANELEVTDAQLRHIRTVLDG